MPLELVIDKLDGLADPVKSLYVEKDGKFHLDVNGYEDPAGLKTALQKQRAANKSAKDTIALWTKLGKSPDEIEALIAEKDASAAEAAKKAGNVDAIVKQQ